MADPDEKQQFRIIMEKVPADKQTEAALFLSGCFSLPQTSTKGIAASGPIALIAGIDRKQADAIMAELAPALPADVTLRVADGEDKTISRLQWPRPPRIYGRDLDEFADNDACREVRCPVCGSTLRITCDSSSARASAAVERRRGDTAAVSAPASDQDPLFSGIKPLSAESSKFASMRSLQAGDTGFWLDFGHSGLSSPLRGHPSRSDLPGGERAGGNSRGGLSAFLKPGVFAVVVGRTRDAQIVKMIAEIMGIDEAEARDKALNLGLCVAQGIALEEAQTLLARFRNLGARARIVKPM